MPTTPRGYPLLTESQTYALVDDYNKLATKADAEATVTEARAQETADAAKAYADRVAAQTRTAAVNLSNEAKVIASEALDAVSPVRDLVDSANAKADSALSTAEAAYAYNQALVAPAAEIVDAVVTDPASEAGALVASKVGRGELVFNVKDFGAKGDGVTDDSDAILAATKALVDASGGERNQHPTLRFPPGKFVVTQNAILNTIAAKWQVGLNITGAGMGSSILHLTGTMGEEKFFWDNGLNGENGYRWQQITISDLGFTTDGVMPTQPTDPLPRGGFMRQWSAGAEKFTKVFRCDFSGPWNNLFVAEGTGNADQTGWFACHVSGVTGSLMHLNNPQSVLHGWYDCTVNLHGHGFTIGPGGGGDVRVVGGSWTMFEPIDGLDKYLVNVPPHATIGPGNGTFVITQIRTEMRGDRTNFVRVRDGAQAWVTFNDCNLWPVPYRSPGVANMAVVGFRAKVTFKDTLLPPTFGATVTGGTGGAGGSEVVVDGASLLLIDGCTTDPGLDGRVTITGAGRAIATNLNTYTGGNALTRNAAASFDLGWQNAGRGTPSPTAKIACLRPSGTPWPGSGAATEFTARIPKGALITRVVARRPAGSGSAYDYTLHVGSDDKTVKLASSTTKPANQGTIIDAPVSADVGQEPKLQTVRMWADHQAFSVPAGGPAAWVEYI